MQSLNYIANHTFARLFSYLLNQRYTDTLCGTKVLRRADYEEIARNRAYFGNFDPLGDFDLIFGAAKLNLKTAEVRSDTPPANTVRPTSRASGTAGCCCRWSYSPS